MRAAKTLLVSCTHAIAPCTPCSFDFFSIIFSFFRFAATVARPIIAHSTMCLHKITFTRRKFYFEFSVVSVSAHTVASACAQCALWVVGCGGGENLIKCICLYKFRCFTVWSLRTGLQHLVEYSRIYSFDALRCVTLQFTHSIRMEITFCWKHFVSAMKTNRSVKR